MSASHGRFVWYELMTTDTKAAQDYYTKVAGWGAQPAPNASMPYTLFNVGDTPVGGMMDQPEESKKMGTPPSWLGYVGVDDVDATTDHARRLGGAVYVEPRDIPNVGRFSVIADPQKAVIGLFKWSIPMPDAPVRAGISQAHIGEPDHQPRTRDVVHRRPFMGRHVHANDGDRVVLEFDTAEFRCLSEAWCRTRRQPDDADGNGDLEAEVAHGQIPYLATAVHVGGNAQRRYGLKSALSQGAF